MSKISKQLGVIAAVAEYGKEQYLAGFERGLSELDFVATLIDAMPKTADRDNLYAELKKRKQQVRAEVKAHAAERLTVYQFLNEVK